MMQLVRVTQNVTVNELESSYCAHLKTEAYHWKGHLISILI